MDRGHRSMDLPEAFYLRIGEQDYEPTLAAVGPWAPDLLHGGPPIALLTRAIRDFQAREDLQVARLGVEILGPVPLAPCRIEVRMARAGRRVELVEARMSAAGREVLLARAWRLQREPGCVAAVPDAFELPALPGPQPQQFFEGVDHFPYGDAIEWRFTRGGFDSLGPATVWGRPRIALVKGQESSGLERLLLLLDSANGLSAELPVHSWSFVPVDLQLSLYREPGQPWIGIDARTAIDPAGVGTSHATVFDADGACGRSLHTLFIRPR